MTVIVEPALGVLRHRRERKEPSTRFTPKAAVCTLQVIRVPWPVPAARQRAEIQLRFYPTPGCSQMPIRLKDITTAPWWFARKLKGKIPTEDSCGFYCFSVEWMHFLSEFRLLHWTASEEIPSKLSEKVVVQLIPQRRFVLFCFWSF